MGKKNGKSGQAARDALHNMISEIGDPDEHDSDDAQRWHKTHEAVVKALPALGKHIRMSSSMGTYDKGGGDSSGWDNGKGERDGSGRI